MVVDSTVIVLCTIIFALLVHSWRKYQSTTDKKLAEIKIKLTRIDPRVEKVAFYTDPDESYTLGKKEVYMCVKDKSGNYYHDDVLMYIALHELAHVLIPEDTSMHPPKFDQLFSQLKERAEHMKLYNPATPFPKEYCGKALSYY